MELIQAIAVRIAKWIPIELGYRLAGWIASIGVLVVLRDAAISHPSDVVRVFARWAGLDLTNGIDTWVRWVTAPERAGAIADTAGLLVVVGLIYVAIWARQRREMFSGAACLTFIAFAVYLEARGDRFALSWAYVIVAIIAWSVWCVRQGDEEAPLIALCDLFVTTLWLPLLLLASAVSLRGSSTRRAE